MIKPTSFLLEHNPESGIAIITLNRPERLNALTFEVYTELRDTFRSLETAAHIRTIIITGTGKAFCSGGDVHEIIGDLVNSDAKELLEFNQLTCDLVRAIFEYPHPVIGALNGTTAGAGAVIATACDIRIAVPSARIAFLFTKVGLSGADMGAAWLLPRLVGLGRATELLLTGDFISAGEAYRIGLYNRLVANDENVVDAASSLATALTKAPTTALRETKKALHRELSVDFSTALDQEAKLQALLMKHPDFREAYNAFVTKRPPRFS
tara:strand:+ start:737 stop:1537 length:801 start_codon:yes stop_codon:yes gene_type:complete